MAERGPSPVASFGGKVGGATTLAARGGAERSVSPVSSFSKSFSSGSNAERRGTSAPNGIQKFSVMGNKPVEKMSVMHLAKADVARPTSFSQLPDFNPSVHNTQTLPTNLPTIEFSRKSTEGKITNASPTALVPKSDIQTPVSVDRISRLARQPDATLAQLQPNEPKVVIKGFENFGRTLPGTQNIKTDAPRITEIPQVVPLTPTRVEPLIQPTPLEVAQLPIVENRPYLTTPTPMVPDRGAEQQAQKLVTVREQLHAAQAEMVDGVKPVAPLVSPEASRVLAPKPTDGTEIATPRVPATVNAEPVAKVDVQPKKIKAAKTFSGLLKEREKAKSDLQHTAKQTETVRAIAHALPQGQELVAVEGAGAIREYVIQPTITINKDDVLLAEAEKEERKKREEKQEAFKLLFGIRWQLPKLQLPGQTKTKAVAQTVGLTQLQELDQKRTQAVRLAAPNHVQPEINAQTQQVAIDLPAATETTANEPLNEGASMVLVYQANVRIKMETIDDTPSDEENKKKKVAKVYKPAEQGRLKQLSSAIKRVFSWADFSTTHPLSEVAANLDEPNEETKSHVTLVPEKQPDGSDSGHASWRSMLAKSKALVTATLAWLAGYDAILSNPAGIIKKEDNSQDPDLKAEQLKRILKDGGKQEQVAA
ncbi:MAG: hypothetical protein ACREHC_00995 [Candidatus Levyibacteriota bacterium]